MPDSDVLAGPRPQMKAWLGFPRPAIRIQQPGEVGQKLPYGSGVTTMQSIQRRWTRRAAVGLALFAATMFDTAHAQSTAPGWPTQTVKIIVPVAAGTATDITARVFGDKLSAIWGKPVIVENKIGRAHV